jgi:Ras-related protein Rab-18
MFKCVLIGDSGVGKTALLCALTNTMYTGKETIGVDFRIIEFDPDHKAILWDTSGLKQFRCITKMYIRDMDGLVFVYDITRRETFEGLTGWLTDLMEVMSSSPNRRKRKLWLLGYKSDCDVQRTVLHQEAEMFAKDHHMEYHECSRNDPQDEFWKSFKHHTRHHKTPPSPPPVGCFDSWYINL